MDFGLGLVLSFTDNATAGINNAVNSLNNLTNIAENASTSLEQMASLSALSVVSNQIGSSFLNMGSTIISTLSQAVKKVTDTGTTLMYAGNQLQMLYSDLGEGAGDMMLGKIQDYAKKSIFAFEDLIPVVTSLKAVGIEAFDEIATSTGSASQTLMDYASDLAAFAPQMKNAYGTGIKAAMGALREYIAEGNAMSLKRGAGIDITAILGEDKGGSIEERSQQVADLIDKLGMLGMTASLAGTPMQRLSNMGDVLFQTIAMISESGVYDKFSSLIAKISDYVFAIPEEELKSIANTIGGALTSIMTPLEWVVDKVLALADSLRNLVSNNPKLVKLMTIAVAITGVFLVLAGVALKVTSAFSGLSLMFLASGKTFSSLGSLFRVGALKMMGVLLPLTALIGLLYLSWKNDFAGIRTNLTYFVTNVMSSFKTARQAVSGSVEDMVSTLNTLGNKNDFFSKLTIGLMKMMVLFKAVADGWNDFTLSEETFLKAKELGILPLVEAILDLKYRFDFFKQGFLDGWKAIGDTVSNVVMGFLDSLDGTMFEGLADGVLGFLQSLSGSDTDAWYNLGETFSKITAIAIPLLTVLLKFKKVKSIFSGIFSVVKPLLGLIVAHPIVALIIGVITALGVLYAKSESFRDLVNNVFNQLKQGAMSFIAELAPLIAVVAGTLKQLLPQMLSAFTRIGQALIPIIESVFSLAMQLLPTLSSIIGTIISVVISLMPTIMNVITTIANILATVFEIVGELMDLVIPFIVDLVEQIGGLINDILPVIADLLADVIGAVMNVVNLVLPMIKSIIQALMPIIKTIMDIVSSIVAKLIPVIKSIISIVANIIKAVISIIMPIITVVMQIVQAIIVILAPIVDIILKAVGFIIDIIMGIVQVVVSIVEVIVAVISGIVQFIMGIVNVIVQVIMSIVSVIVGIVTTIIETITSIISGIIAVFQGIWDFIVNLFSNAVGFFSDVFTSVYNVIAKIFQGIADFFTGIWNGIISVFTTIGDTISGAVKGAINSVLKGAIKIINGFIGAINGAIGFINKIPGVEIKKLTKLEVPELAKGGVVDKPTLSLVGEAGKEAVVPLENNTGWITGLANVLASEIRNITPTNTNISNNTNNQQGNTTNRYMTSNTTNTQTVQGDTDNSITFNKGAIQITAQNTSDEEALRLARKIMEYIKRQKEIDDMVNYA